jgi:hypothetical protein
VAHFLWCRDLSASTLVFLFFNFEITCIQAYIFPFGTPFRNFFVSFDANFMTSPVGNLLLKKNWFIEFVKVVK